MLTGSSKPLRRLAEVFARKAVALASGPAPGVMVLSHGSRAGTLQIFYGRAAINPRGSSDTDVSYYQLRIGDQTSRYHDPEADECDTDGS